MKQSNTIVMVPFAMRLWAKGLTKNLANSIIL